MVYLVEDLLIQHQILNILWQLHQIDLCLIKRFNNELLSVPKQYLLVVRLCCHDRKGLQLAFQMLEVVLFHQPHCSADVSDVADVGRAGSAAVSSSTSYSIAGFQNFSKIQAATSIMSRSEERRVGKECRL